MRTYCFNIFRNNKATNLWSYNISPCQSYIVRCVLIALQNNFVVPIFHSLINMLRRKKTLLTLIVGRGNNDTLPLLAISSPNENQDLEDPRYKNNCFHW